MARRGRPSQSASRRTILRVDTSEDSEQVDIMTDSQSLLDRTREQRRDMQSTASALQQAHSPLSHEQPASIQDSHARAESTPTITGIHDIDRDTQELMQIMRDLRHLGVKGLKMPLPSICVVGDQSTGKSSLIEAISDLKSPRAADACTRCPLELNLSSSDEPWRCEVHIISAYSWDPDLQKAKITTRRPLGPWKDRPKEIIHFSTLKSKEQVREALKWAQIAILNPDQYPHLYKKGERSGQKATYKVNFSPNVISGQGLRDLSLFDLPGVISHDEEKYVSELTINLVKNYIENEDCNILLTQTMNHDVANSRAASIIREKKAEGRTIGILTKPDLLGTEANAVVQYRDILSGKKYHLGGGYHVVKNEADPAIENTTARENEKRFFETDERFARDLAEFSDKFGTGKLNDRLEKMLKEKSLACLPRVYELIYAKIESDNHELKCLPQPPGNDIVFHIHTKIIVDFLNAVKQEIEGSSFEETLFFRWHKAFEEFHDSLTGTCPRLLFQSGARKHPGGTTRPLTKQEPRSTPIAPSVEPDPIILDDDSDSEGYNSVSPRAFCQPQGQGARFNVPDIRKLVECVSRGVLGARDPRVTEQLHIDGTKHWPRLYEAFLEKSLRMVEQALLKSVETAFEPWRSTRLVREIESIVKIFLNNTWREQSNFITLLWDMEKNKVMTGNSAMINHFEHEYREGLQKRSINCRADNLMRKLQREQPKPGNSSKSNTQKLPDINKLRESIKGKPDPYSTEIDLMATLQAYYRCSASRFADNVGLVIRAVCFSRCINELHLAVKRGLYFDRENDEANLYCRKLLAVDPKDEERRQELLKSLADLDKATIALERFRAKHQSPDINMGEDDLVMS